MALSFAANSDVESTERCEAWEVSMILADMGVPTLIGLEGVAGLGGALSPTVPIEREGSDAIGLDGKFDARSVPENAEE